MMQLKVTMRSSTTLNNIQGGQLQGGQFVAYEVLRFFFFAILIIFYQTCSCGQMIIGGVQTHEVLEK